MYHLDLDIFPSQVRLDTASKVRFFLRFSDFQPQPDS